MRISSVGRKRPAVTEALGAVLAIAMTLIAGAAVFGWVNQQTGVQERQYQQNAGAAANALAERYVIVNVNYSSSVQNKVTLWVYNFGSVVLNPIQVFVYNNTRSMSGVYSPTATNPTAVTCGSGGGCTSCSSASLLASPGLYNTNTKTGLGVTVGTIQPITLTLCGSVTFHAGKAYGFSVVGLYGNSVTYYQNK